MAQHNKSKMHATTEFVAMPFTAFKSPAPSSLAKSRQPCCIRFVLPDGRSIDAVARPFIMLGRADESSATIDVDFEGMNGAEKGVSREHAVVMVIRNQVLLKDFNSRNGTWLNGQELYSMREYQLRDGDEILLGRLSLRVQFLY